MLKANKGITLVALVITIIVLLILAGVSISMIMGQEGLITKSQTAAEKYNGEAQNESIILTNIEQKFQALIEGLESASSASGS